MVLPWPSRIWARALPRMLQLADETFVAVTCAYESLEFCHDVRVSCNCGPVHRPIASGGSGVGVTTGLGGVVGAFVGGAVSVAVTVGVGVGVPVAAAVADGAAVAVGVGLGFVVAVGVATIVAEAPAFVADVPVHAANAPARSTAPTVRRMNLDVTDVQGTGLNMLLLGAGERRPITGKSGGTQWAGALGLSRPPALPRSLPPKGIGLRNVRRNLGGSRGYTASRPALDSRPYY